MWSLWFDWHPLDEVTERSRHCGDPDVERVQLSRCQRPLVWVRRQPLPELPPSADEHDASLLLL